MRVLRKNWQGKVEGKLEFWLSMREVMVSSSPYLSFFLEYRTDDRALLGKTVIPPSEVEGEQTSMELGNMVDDLLQLLKIVFPEREKAPGLVLVGHSMVCTLLLISS